MRDNTVYYQGGNKNQHNEVHNQLSDNSITSKATYVSKLVSLALKSTGFSAIFPTTNKNARKNASVINQPIK